MWILHVPNKFFQSAIVRTQRLTVADAGWTKKPQRHYPQRHYKLTSPSDQTALCTPIDVTMVVVDVLFLLHYPTSVKCSFSHVTFRSHGVFFKHAIEQNKLQNKLLGHFCSSACYKLWQVCWKQVLSRRSLTIIFSINLACMWRSFSLAENAIVIYT